jgi:hypothetical protein
MKQILIICWVLVLLITGAVSAANDMAGDWRASNGYTVHIPGGAGSFSLVFESPKGEKIMHPAQWVTAGREFTWTDKQNSKHTASLDPANPNRIQDVNSSYPGSPAYWYRIKK